MYTTINLPKGEGKLILFCTKKPGTGQECHQLWQDCWMVQHIAVDGSSAILLYTCEVTQDEG